ncbi:hypothetical protein M9Y10_003246 [Tritrichomonas musculus]|uniref:Adenylate and Guanylate cyclase catalytic domain containing protein n=1 Tax=Tritrichomonas musculus TaxID=1915356 RepID=A0ABR2JQ83_9EUKA
MKADETQNGATSFLQTNSISFNSSNHMKYNGLIEQSFYKKLFNDLSQLFNYVYADAPPFTIVHHIVTVIRLLQIGGPSLCAGYYSLWSNSDSARDTVSILSIFFHLIPPSGRDIASVYFLIIYIVILVCLLTLLFVSAVVYRKSANLPSIIPPIISFYFAFFGVILHPIAFELAFSELGRAIFEESHYSVVPLVILFVISFAISLLYFWIFLMIAQQSIMFRPNSLLTVCSQPQTITFVLQLVITVFTGFPETLTDKTNFQGIMLVFAGIAYFASIYNAFFYGGIVSPVMTAAFLSTCITSGINCFINAIILFINKQATLIFVIIYIILFIVVFVVSLVLWNKKRTKHLQILDGILDDVSRFDDIKSVNTFVNLAVDGFYVAHPVCINWQFLKLGIEKWPQNQMTWFVYAKFVSIYPEETQTLAWIFRMIVTKKVKGSAAKTVKEQSLSVARQREPNLSTDLKSKLNSVSKHVTSTKHKLRHVWDLAIQGNINDMEAATKRAISEIEKSDAELLHVIHQFPNNRFVTRQYARFCSELKADRQAYMDMIEKTRMLQRGITVNKDQAHEFGLAVFHQLPDKINISKDSNALQGQGTESMTTSQMEIETEDENNQGADDSLILVQRIDSLVIPATRYSIVYRLIMVLILFVAPAIFFFVYTPIYQNSLTEPLQYVQHITMIRTLLYQITAFSETRVYEALDFFSPPKITTRTKEDLEKYGGYWDTRDELISITSQVSLTMQQVEEFRTYQSNSKYIAQGKSNLFDSVVNYSYYVGLNSTNQMITVQNGLADFVLQQKDIVEENVSLPDSIVNSSVTLNLIINLPEMANRIDDTLNCLTQFITEKDNNYQKLFKIIMISVICFCVVVFLIGLIVQLVWINSNKEQVYKCLTALPKNAVSALTENLRVLKKEAENSSTANANTEMNKQEDNIMKIFVIGGSSSSTKMIDAILLITSSIVMIGMHVGCTIVFITLLQSQSKYIRQNSPHLNYLQGAYSNAIGCASSLILLGINANETRRVGPMTREYILDQYQTRINAALNYYHLARFGGQSADDPPYSGFLDGVEYAQQQIVCDDKENTPDLLEISKCYSPDLLYILIQSVWESKIKPFQQTTKQGLGDELAMNIIWSFLIFPIYYAFFNPMAMSIVGNIENHLKELRNNDLVGFVIMFAIAIIFEIIATIQALRIEKHMKKVLRLLLHVPTKIVMQTPKIMRILGGDFKKQRGDGATRDNEFFRSVVQNLPDAVLVSNAEMKIETVNKSFIRVMSVEETEVIGKTLNEFFGDKFNGNVQNLLQVANGGKSKTENLCYHKEGTEVNLEATSYLINQHPVILFRDTTQTVRYNTLIKEEKSKSDVLLSSILPPSLVKRVQAGEQNISFAVQTATIVFMDIVSFTPWCGSLPADKVMATLNNLFRRFDAALAREPTMTKIKCIGDCYMAAGGVFAEVNQPAEHAKEVVMFGLDSLQCILDLNEELNEKLQIRVGINTGGPIVAGVLGIGKPTFEIIGPAINMAQQMEHHGVPMQVHVSRSVYELIYGDTFVIKERGVVEVKGGSVVTYLVSKSK